MANVAQLVTASGCGSEGRGFDPHHSPQIKYIQLLTNLNSCDTIEVWASSSAALSEALVAE